MRAWPLVITLALLVSCDSPELRPCAEEDEVFVFVDADNDGWGTEPIGYVCNVGDNEALNSLDCNDDSADVNPAAEELCDDLDNNCDGRIDEGLLSTAWYADLDGDGFGDPYTQLITCSDPPPGYVVDSNDCDDNRDDRFPGNPEICANGIDEDCSGTADDITEVCNDGVDDDCDGFADCDDTDCDASPFCLWQCADFPLDSIVPVSANGSTVGQGNDLNPGCGASQSPDVAYQFTAPQTGDYVFDTFGSQYDTVLALYLDCGTPAVTCNDDWIGLQSQVELFMNAGDVVIIGVDGFSTASGNYVLNVDRY